MFQENVIPNTINYKLLVDHKINHETSNTFGTPTIGKVFNPVFNFVKTICYTETSQDKKTYYFDICKSDLNEINNSSIKLNCIHIEFINNDVESITYNNVSLHKILFTTTCEGKAKCVSMPLNGLPVYFSFDSISNDIAKLHVTFKEYNSDLSPKLVVSYSQNVGNMLNCPTIKAIDFATINRAHNMCMKDELLISDEYVTYTYKYDMNDLGYFSRFLYAVNILVHNEDYVECSKIKTNIHIGNQELTLKEISGVHAKKDYKYEFHKDYKGYCMMFSIYDVRYCLNNQNMTHPGAIILKSSEMPNNQIVVDVTFNKQCKTLPIIILTTGSWYKNFI